MLLSLHILILILLYTILWFKGNSKPLFDIQLTPFSWWLYTGLITNYLGLTAWWYLVENHKVWGAIAITYCMHTCIELGLSFYFYEPPSTQQASGLFLLVLGTFLVLK